MKIFVPLLILSLTAAGSAQASNLWDIYQTARKSDPELREAEANLRATEQLTPQARAGLLPSLSVGGSYDDQSSNGSSTFLTTGTSGPVIVSTNQETESETTSWQIQLQQPVFRMDRFHTLKQSKQRVLQSEIDYEIAEQNLAVRVSERYFDVLAAEDLLHANTAAKEAIGRQLEQAETRFEVGLSAITDVDEARAAYDRASADMISAKQVLANAKESLRAITGEFPATLARPGSKIAFTPPENDADAWLQQALESNLSIQSQRAAVEISQKDIDIQRAGYFPTLDFVATKSDFDSSSTQINDGISGPADSDGARETLSLQLNVPLYQGGVRSARVREAMFRHRAARERLERITRDTERSTRDAYLGVVSDVARVKALNQALKSSETALRATETGYDVGTRTTVDVLDARRAALSAEQALLRSQYDYLLNVLRLKSATGSLNETDIQNINAILVASE